MTIIQENRQLNISTPLGENFLLLQKLSAREEISSLFQYELELWHEEAEENGEPTYIDPKKILGKPVTILIKQADGTERYFNGVVNEFAQGGRSKRFSIYQATVVPQIWILTQNFQSRIFQQISVPDILRKIFKGFEVSYELQGSYEPRNYCVQYQETDFAFASRLMEEEGIYYYFEHTEDNHKLIIADTPQSHRDCPSKSNIEYCLEISSNEGFVSAIRTWNVRNNLQTGKVTFWDHNFQLPTKRFEAEQPTLFSVGNNKELEIYEYPAGYARKQDGIAPDGGEQSGKLQKIFEDNHRTAQVRMQELDAQSQTASGLGDCASLVAGHRFQLKNHPTAANNIQHILVSVMHEAVQSPAYETGDPEENAYLNSFSCIPHGKGFAPFRPKRLTPKPIVRGSQTATVVGPAGEEIFTDKYGRVKVQFHWDREGKYDAASSCWMRVGQLWAGKKWGAMFVPRIGMEVIVDFLEGNPDQPIITGSVYNAETMPPYALPDEKTKSGIKTDSTKGGGGFNELRFEDKKGEEQVFIHAEKNLDVRVKNDSLEYIGNERHMIVKNSQYEKVSKDKHLQVVGDHNEKIDGSMSLKIGMDLDEKVGMKYAVDAGQEIHLKSGVNLTIETGTNLTLKVGGNFININPAGIFISGTMVMLNSGGSAGSGSGANLEAPKDPKEADKAKEGERVGIMPPVPPLKPKNYSQAAQVLKKASKEGTPFCEVCSKQQQ